MTSASGSSTGSREGPYIPGWKSCVIPHPKSRFFYRKAEYMDFVSSRAELPLLTKVNTGSTGKGVRIVRFRLAAGIIAHLAFGVFNNKAAPGYSPQTTGRVIPFPAVDIFQRHHLRPQKCPIRVRVEGGEVGNSHSATAGSWKGISTDIEASRCGCRNAWAF